MLISSKFLTAKPGDLFCHSVKQHDDGPKFLNPKVLEFVGISQFAKGEDEWTQMVEFKILATGEFLYVDPDDRYGDFPRLTRARFDQMVARKRQLEMEIETIDSICTQFIRFMKV